MTVKFHLTAGYRKRYKATESIVGHSVNVNLCPPLFARNRVFSSPYNDSFLATG